MGTIWCGSELGFSPFTARCPLRPFAILRLLAFGILVVTRPAVASSPVVLCVLLLMLTWTGCTVYRSYHDTSCSDTGNDVQLLLLHHLSQRGPLIWRCRCLIYLKQAPSFGDATSSSTLNTAPRLAFPVQVFLKDAPWFGDSGSRYFLNTLPRLAIPVHHIS